MNDEDRMNEWRNWPKRGLMKIPQSMMERRDGGTIEAMLKHARKQGMQRKNGPLAKHGNETFRK